MSNRYIAPTANAMVDMLAMVFGEGVEVSNDDDTELAGKHAATFLDDEDKLVALCVCDLPFVTYSGAALSMVPAAAANDMLNEKFISDVVAQNFHEVMNICSSLMMSDSSAHLRLEKVLNPESSASAIEKLGTTDTLIAFSLKIPNYGDGKIAFAIS